LSHGAQTLSCWHPRQCIPKYLSRCQRKERLADLYRFRSLSEILQILSITLFENSSLLQVFTDSQLQKEKEPFSNQLKLFNS
jgi:hypothetical protein